MSLNNRQLPDICWHRNFRRTLESRQVTRKNQEGTSNNWRLATLAHWKRWNWYSWFIWYT